MRSKPYILALSFPLVAGFSWVSIAYWDAPLAIQCRSLNRSAHRLFDVIAAFGDSLFYLIAFFLGMLAFKFIYKSNHYALVCLFFFLAIASSGLAADALKFILGRSRPNLLLKQNIYTFEPFQIERNMTSFPSGHAATITALVCALYCFFPKPKYLYIATAALVAGSRVLITAHYLSDVVFGAYVALLVTPFVKYRFEKEGGRIFTPSARQ